MKFFFVDANVRIESLNRIRLNFKPTHNGISKFGRRIRKSSRQLHSGGETMVARQVQMVTVRYENQAPGCYGQIMPCLASFVLVLGLHLHWA
jgi:hypothetical protein